MAQQSSDLWPQGKNKDLIISIAHYLRDLLNQNSSKLDEVSVDSLQIATDSLQTMIDPDSDNLPPSPFQLTALYSSYKHKSSPQQSEESKEATTGSTNTSTNRNVSKQRKKFLEFLQVLKKHDFFKNVEEGSDAYQQRMEKARNQYNSRFPNMRIDSLDWINSQNNAKKRVISEDDKQKAETLKQAGNQLLGQKKYTEAIEKYTAAIEYNDQNAVYFSNRAAAYTYLRQYAEAISDASVFFSVFVL